MSSKINEIHPNPYLDIQNTIAPLTPIEGLLYVVKALKDPQFGCPWDKNLTQKDIIPLTLEEVYEVIEAVGNNNRHAIEEELGDLLFHIVLYGTLADISLDSIAANIRDKMIKRHPHVFQGAKIHDDEVSTLWEKTKQSKDMTFHKAYPALLLAERTGKLAAREGFDWDDALSALAKVKEEVEETEQAIQEKLPDKIEEEYGDMLFAAAQLGRKLDLQPEYTLYQAVHKFIVRYNTMKQSQDDFNHLPMSEKDLLWNKTKERQYMFRKMNGIGNDFVIFDARHEEINLTSEQIRKICDRNTGIGCDQLILIHAPTKPRVDAKIVFYNQDGKPASACGNGSRCVGSFTMQSKDQCHLETCDRVLHLQKNQDDTISVNMGKACSQAPTLPDDVKQLLPLVPEAENCVAIDVGNPHAVFMGIPSNLVEQLPLADFGPSIECHPSFPQRCNVSLLSKIDDENFRLRVWERGAGITQACGTAACAAMAALLQTKSTHLSAINFHLNGGVLNVRIDKDQNLWLTGKTETNFHGIWII